MTPTATYRLQFHKDFGFDRARELAPYLASLGISHVYASPYLKARPGSTHGYDIVDHHALNPELGDEGAFGRMVAALKACNLGQILDFVPNHMGVGGADNPLWLDVLEWGPDSLYCGWFDIDWDPDRRYLRDKLLVPFLGDQYGGVLEAGQLVLKFDDASGSFAVWAYDAHKLPICPLDYARILGDAHPKLERIGDAFSGLPAWRPQVPLRAAQLKAELAQAAQTDPDVRDAIADAVARFTGLAGDLESWRRLDRLIGRQHWRAAHFSVAGDDINYRRFFNINDLAGLKMELPELFEHAHRLVFDLLAEGTLDGLRIDHVDGLYDPKAYLQTLRTRGGKPFYLVVEKILAQHEQLREDWPVEGTTGYEFANLVLGLLIDDAAEAKFTEFYESFTGERRGFADIVRDCKIRIMQNEMASELNVLARDAARAARHNPRTADFTRNILQRALLEIIACFPVYRTYVDGSPPQEGDRRYIDWAVKQARRTAGDLDPSVFTFLHRLLTTDLIAEPRSGFSRHAVVRVAMKLQQYSGPVMAKGLEDTAFYRYNRFVALNEVGGHPDHFALGVTTFHRANAQRLRSWPHAMLGTSTHDTKRGEDTRARLAALSELPEEWLRCVQTWSRILRARRGDVEGTAPPDRNDEYLFYQLLIGSWPAEMTDRGTPASQAVLAYAERIKGAMVKSMREAKRHSTWAAPDTAYEDAMLGFVQDALDPEKSAAFMDSFLPFQARVARIGVQNSLVQAGLKLTVPGMPDIYQGSELWDFSLVDPDNRRPVDFAARMDLLAGLSDGLLQDRRPTMRRLLADWQDGGIKLALTTLLLRHRREHPVLFGQGSYDVLEVAGAGADRICAFARRLGEDAIVVVARRLPGREMEEDTAVSLPDGTWIDLLTGTPAPSGRASELLADLPICVLVPR